MAQKKTHGGSGTLAVVSTLMLFQGTFAWCTCFRLLLGNRDKAWDGTFNHTVPELSNYNFMPCVDLTNTRLESMDRHCTHTPPRRSTN